MSERDPVPDPEAYPHDRPVEERLRFALRFAVLAPSTHNSQPWLFRIEGDHVDVLLDRTRALPVVDPHDRELVTSCAAALHHLRTALAACGEQIVVDLMPFPGVLDVLARVAARGRIEPDPAAVERLEAATRRRTTRLPFAGGTVRTSVIDRVWEAARAEGAALHVAEDDVKRAALRLVTDGDHEQMGDPSFRRELASWMHGNRSRCRDGMPGYALGLGDVLAAVSPAVVRTFDMGKSRAAQDIALGEHSPILALLATRGDTVLDWLHAGQALSALLLDATVVGLSASFLNQPIEVPRLREELAGLFAPGTVPQQFLRLGEYAGEPPRPTPRRALEDVLV
jgi:nitroreductase